MLDRTRMAHDCFLVRRGAVSIMATAVLAGVASAAATYYATSLGFAVTLSTVTLLVIALRLRGSTGGLDLFAPVSIFLLSYFLLFVLRPAYAIGTNALVSGFLNHAVPHTYGYAILLAALGLISFVAGHQSFIGEAVGRTIPSPPMALDWIKAKRCIAGLMTLSLIGFGLFLARNGGIGFLGTLFAGRSSATANAFRTSSGYLYSAPLAMAGVGLWCMTWGAARKSGRLSAAGLVISAYSLIVASGQGSRSYLIPQILSVLMVYFLSRDRRPTMRFLAIVAILVFIFGITVPRIYRVTGTQSGGVTEAVKASFDVKTSIDEFLLGADTAMVDALALELDAVPERISYTNGSTYLGALVRPIPKELLDSKPSGSADAILNAKLFPQTYSRGTGFSFSVFGEPYLNFGWVGVIGVMGIFGMVVRAVWSWFLRFRLNPGAIAVIALCSPYCFVFIRGGFGADYQRLLVALIPLLLLMVFSSAHPKKTRDDHPRASGGQTRAR